MTLATIIGLLAIIPASIYLFGRYPPVKAGMLTMFAGVLFLPAGGAAFDPPLIPPIDKYGMTALCMFALGISRAASRFAAARSSRIVLFTLLFVVVIGVGAAQTNQDVLRYGSWRVTIVPPMSFPWDALSVTIRLWFGMLLPFVVGRMYLRTSKDLRTFFVLLAGAGLVYAPLCLWEIRMSPQLHSQIYGFAPHSFSQQVRADGYRPMVFLGHGLVVAFFMFLATSGTAVLLRSKIRRVGPLSTRAALPLLSVTLLLCKTAAAAFYAVVAVALILKGSVKTQVRAGLVLMFIVVTFPILRMTDVFPADDLVDLANQYLGPDRAQSLEFRFDNETLLLDKALERPYFGWGGYSREHIYDPEIGKDLTLQAGTWIIVLGIFGVLGFATYYLLLLGPFVMMLRSLPRVVGDNTRLMFSALGLLVAFFSVNTLPNSEFGLLQFFAAGGLSGLAEVLPAETRARAKALKDKALATSTAQAEPSGEAKPRDGLHVA